ncbi:MAG: xanthine phosphoribosyltransferase [Deltaproteobacteria bacterium]|nr:xanthine phosphoribosyltransferase [Deltaproteobacteria bacterium]
MKDRYTKTFPISWEQLHRDAKALAWKLVDLQKWAGLVAVTRGGMVPAAVIARELDIHHVETVCVSSYDWQDQASCKVIKRPCSAVGPDWLVVDDLVDTGRTARVIRDMLPDAHFAALYAKPAGRSLVDTYITEVSQDTWILFPWDSESRFVEPIAGLKAKNP